MDSFSGMWVKAWGSGFRREWEDRNCTQQIETILLKSFVGKGDRKLEQYLEGDMCFGSPRS